MNLISPDFYHIPSFEQKYISVKGHVQSGKTLFMIHATQYFIEQKISCAFILRNSFADREQLYNRLNDIYPYPHIIKKVNGKPFSEKKQSIPHILFSLANSSNLKKLTNKLSSSTVPYVLFIDEVDAVDFGSSVKMEFILDLKQQAWCTFGISATIMDTLFRENITPDHLLVLNVPQNYRGILNIKTVPFFSDDFLFSSKKNDNLSDIPELCAFIDNYIHTNHTDDTNDTNHTPKICLFNICRCIEPYYRLQTDLSHKYPNLTTLVYNGQGVTYKKGEEEWTKKITISQALQFVKENKKDHHPLLIFSGDLAGRGISFVSEDYQWHLTDEVLIVAESTDEPDLIQKIRLCGCYDDDIPLTLYTTEKTINDLKKAFYRQEEYISECLKYKENKKICRSIICDYPMSYSKFTTRKMTKDHVAYPLNKVKKNTGWSYDLESYEHQEHKKDKKDKEKDEKKEEKEKEEKKEEKDNKDIIIKINKKMTREQPTIESIFLSMLNVEMEYTTDELIDLLEKAGYQQPKSMFKVMTTPDKEIKNKKRYGTHYFDRVDHKDDKDDIWKIRECLKICWKM